MLRIGITGGIGSGKTIIAGVFSTLGIPVYNADMAAKRLMNTNEALKENITRYFGPQSYTNGELNRSYIAGIVFNDSYKLDLLNALVHPVTIQDAEDWMRQQTAPYILKEAALLFETSAKEGLDYIIGVYAPEHLRIHRVMNRDHISREEVMKRIHHQLDENIKMKLCDFIIRNDEKQLVILQVLALHKKLLSLTALKNQ